ncbi:hypothetical protein OAO01_03895 [Oligoflexia bacterium]|nr:hypothetical protein [Oligoflexia bacterium]
MSFLKRPLSRKEDFFVALFLATIFALLFLSVPCTAWVQFLSLGLLALFLIVFIWITVRTQVRSHHVVKILGGGDPELFLKELENDIQWSRGGYKRMLLVNKAAGLVHAGRSVEAVKLLDFINPQKLRGIFKPLYYNNLLAALTLTDTERARTIFEKNREVFDKKYKQPVLYWALKGTVAAYKLHVEGDLETENTFRGILEADLPTLSKARSYYWLHYLEDRQGNKEAAQAYYAKAWELCPKMAFEPKPDSNYPRGQS